MRRFGLFALALTLGLGAGLRDGFDRWVDRTILPVTLTETSVEMRDRHGALLRVFPVEDGRVRLAVDLAQVDPEFLKMLIRYEDKRFYAHAGVDLMAGMRAVVQAIGAWQVVSGGSTLTMQTARLLENTGTGRWAGKLRQMRVAWALERRLSKEEILALYLTHAPYGGALEGIRAGTLAWFGKEPKRLTAAEAALLVALPQAPEARRPDRQQSNARIARDRVLARSGVAALARQAELPTEMRGFVRLAPHLTDRVQRQDPLQYRHALTLDATLQRQMEALAKRAIHGQARGVSAAIVVADHQTGEVLAAVGSAEYDAADGVLGFVDMTRALRSPGSTLKPLIYAMAFDEGLAHPDTLIRDAPVTFGRYAPQNFDGQFRGEVTVREALQLSLNIPPLLLTQELGPAKLMAVLRKAGTNPQVPGGKPGLAVALGGVGLTLNELVQLYAGLANGGAVPQLRWQMAAPDHPPKQIMSRSAAWQVGHILASVAPPKGVASAADDIAYKTGTSYGHRDAWAIGYDGAHVIGVWLGRPDGTPVPGAFGGDLAAPVLFEAFGRLKARAAPLPSPPPETLLISTAELPQPLQRFRGRDAAFAPDPAAPVVQFPPDGAELVLNGAADIPLKLRAGTLPLTVLVDGMPVVTGLRRRDALVPVSGIGFSRISVVDAQGRADVVHVRVK